MARSTCALIEPFDAVILDHGVAQDIARDGIEVFARLHGDFEKFALANILDAPMAEPVEGSANGLALGVEHRRFECYVDASFHSHQFR
jgi:hypothetical protein